MTEPSIWSSTLEARKVAHPDSYLIAGMGGWSEVVYTTSLSPACWIPHTCSTLDETLHQGVLPVSTFHVEFLMEFLDVQWARRLPSITNSSLTGAIKELQACRWCVKRSLCCMLCGVWRTNEARGWSKIKTKPDVVFSAQIPTVWLDSLSELYGGYTVC